MRILSSILFVIASTDAWAAEYYNIPAGSSIAITEHSICKKITNGGTKGLFVPAKTVTEWQTFYSNLPSGVTSSACCAGAPVILATPSSSYVSYVVPTNCTSVTVKLWGGGGGGATGAGVGGAGGYTEATIAVTAGNTLNVYVGGGGSAGGERMGGGGGGASAAALNSFTTFFAVAAGGGGGGGTSLEATHGARGGAGGGTSGINGSKDENPNGDENDCTGGYGATVTGVGAGGYQGDNGYGAGSAGSGRVGGKGAGSSQPVSGGISGYAVGGKGGYAGDEGGGGGGGGGLYGGGGGAWCRQHSTGGGGGSSAVINPATGITQAGAGAVPAVSSGGHAIGGAIMQAGGAGRVEIIYGN